MTMKDVFDAVRERNDALAHAKKKEEEVVVGLIEARAYDFFSVNWRRLQHEAGRETRMKN